MLVNTASVTCLKLAMLRTVSVALPDGIRTVDVDFSTILADFSFVTHASSVNLFT